MAGQQFPPFTASGTANAAGALSLTFTPRSNDIYRVTQVSPEMEIGASSATCKIRRNGWLVCPVVPSGDAAGGDPTIWLWPGDQLSVEWTGAVAGSLGKITVFYDLGE